MTVIKILTSIIALGTLTGAGFFMDDRLNQSAGLLAMSETHKADFIAVQLRMKSGEARAIKKEIRQLKKESRIIQAKSVKTEQERLMLLELQDEVQAAHIELKEVTK